MATSDTFQDDELISPIIGADRYLLRRLLTAQVPNLTVTDSSTTGIGTTLTQLALITIPGELIRETSRLRLNALFDMAGNDAKNIQFRIGPASGNFSTASQWGGQLGLTTARYVGLSGLIWADNSKLSLRSVPTGQNNWVGSNTSNPSSVFAIDTNLNWNLYIGAQFGVANGAPTNTITLRTYSVVIDV